MSTSKKGPTEIYFSFLCKPSRRYQNGESPIVFRVIYRSERKDVFLKYRVYPLKSVTILRCFDCSDIVS